MEATFNAVTYDNVTVFLQDDDEIPNPGKKIEEYRERRLREIAGCCLAPSRQSSPASSTSSESSIDEEFIEELSARRKLSGESLHHKKATPQPQKASECLSKTPSFDEILDLSATRRYRDLRPACVSAPKPISVKTIQAFSAPKPEEGRKRSGQFCLVKPKFWHSKY